MTRFTPRELDVMGILWEKGEATVQDVRESLEDELAYTSVLSQLQLLERKGHVEHRREGRAYRYRAVAPPDRAGETALARVLDTLYRKSPIRLLAQLVEQDGVSDEDLEEMRRLLEERIEERRETGQSPGDGEGG